MTEIISADDETAFQKTKDAISIGKIVIYPTDTVYGIGCNALNAESVEQIKKIKGRDGNKAMSVILGTLSLIREYCEVSEKQAAILATYLPGPFTFILRLKKGKEKILGYIAGADGGIGIRVPEHQMMRRISTGLGIPIITTSANPSGEKDAIEFGKINRNIVSACDLAIDGGKTKYAAPSTVVDLTDGNGAMKVLRKGAGRI
ncbi:TPA: threonylcarbamoyl-AMP synthase [Candidatus Micrarchaeota archaeon]|nr:threonylcarbamoyl-AMP synthase [Candidatus Micrarchaeota archaeon]